MHSPLTAVLEMRELGGPVVDWIFAACLVLWALVAERTWYFVRILPGRMAETQRVWQNRADRASWSARQIRRTMISQLNAEMNANLKLMRVLVPLCPLLGLLGTVSGMLGVFDSMAALGSADARSMATGVSEAMICTLTALGVSVTGLYPSQYFPRRATRETELLADRLVY
jgi:biopolymer transport protein ExbB